MTPEKLPISTGHPLPSAFGLSAADAAQRFWGELPEWLRKPLLIHALLPNFRVTTVGAPASNWAWRRVAMSRSQLFGATAALAFIVGTVGCSTASSLSPQLTAHCNKLYGLWARYNSRDHNHSGEHAQAELALSDCQLGRFDAGLAQLEHLLREDKIPFLQRSDESASTRPFPNPRTTWTVKAAKSVGSSGRGVGDSL